MKKNVFRRITAVMVMALSFAFFSCSSDSDEQIFLPAVDSGEKVAVTFNLAKESVLSSRAVSSVELASYKYTLKAKNSGGTETTLCEKSSLTNGSLSVSIAKGTYTFTADAYKDESIVLSGTSETTTISASSSSVSIVLKAVAGGKAAVKITLKIADSFNAASVNADLYDSIENAQDTKKSLALDETTNPGYKTVVYSNDAVESGVSKYVIFFLYDSENSFISHYIEPVYIVGGENIDVTRELTAETVSTTKLSSVKIASDKDTIISGETANLTASPAVSGSGVIDITYGWKITSGADYAELSSDGSSATLAGKNETDENQSVKVEVTATANGNSVTDEYTVLVEPKTGTVSIKVEVDGSVTCTKCGKSYETKAEAEACEHYKCETCGSVYYSAEEMAACTSHVTVVFNDVKEDGYQSKESVKVTIKSGDKIPGSVVEEIENWERDGKLVSWVDSNGNAADLNSTFSVDDGETSKVVTFTAKWATAHKVTFKDAEGGTNPSVELDVADGEKIAESGIPIPVWAKEHYTLSWNPTLDLTAPVTADATYTAVWTEDKKFTVTFTDSDSSNGNENVTQDVYSGEKASVPSWSKENYTLSWSSSVDGVSTDSEITQKVTFTANWTEKPKCSNCGTHYDTQAEADTCSKQSGCPKFVAVAVGTYDLTTGGKVFLKQSAGVSQTHNGITVTCTIDSKGANLKTDKNGSNGLITFAIASDMTLTFTDSALKGVVISTTDGYVGESGTLSSSTTKGSYLGADGTSATVKLGAGNYTIVGATSSSAKIASLTFAEITGE